MSKSTTETISSSVTIGDVKRTPLEEQMIQILRQVVKWNAGKDYHGNPLCMNCADIDGHHQPGCPVPLAQEILMEIGEE